LICTLRSGAQPAANRIVWQGERCWKKGGYNPAF
jgi:hypothetical protein